MGEKFWIQDFETGLARLRVHFISERGQIKAIFVIQYEACIDDFTEKSRGLRGLTGFSLW